MKQEQAEASEILASSGVGSDIGIGYGGVDTGGTLDPSVKKISDVNVWNEEW